MREIKFRAWDKETKRFTPPTISIEFTGNFTRVGGYSGESYELMQFTGLKDKNGKEVYEDDIIKWTYGDKEIIEKVEWPFEWSYENCEVIGNIYENPELIK